MGLVTGVQERVSSWGVCGEKGGLKSPGSIAFKLLILRVTELFTGRNGELHSILCLYNGGGHGVCRAAFFGENEYDKWAKVGGIRRTMYTTPTEM